MSGTNPNPPTDPPKDPPQDPPSNDAPYAQMLTALNALPERVAKAVGEVMPQPSTPNPDPPKPKDEDPPKPPDNPPNPPTTKPGEGQGFWSWFWGK